MAVSFSVNVPVIDNEYRYVFDDINIPGGSNSFQVRSQRVNDLHFVVHMFVDFRRSFDAEDGVAEFFEKNVPAGNYEIVVEGNAVDGEDIVRMDFVASQTIRADKDGNFHHEYDTSSLPEGKFNVKIGSLEKVIELMPADSGKQK